MTHLEYLEAHHEAVTKALPSIALSIAETEYDFAAAQMQTLQHVTDALWAQRVASGPEAR